MLPIGSACPATPEAEAFVRFCYQRRRVGWPELYDEMCAVAARGLYHGMGTADLADIGIGFSLFETPRLAELVVRVAREEQEARRAARRAVVDGMAASPPPADAARQEASPASPLAPRGRPESVRGDAEEQPADKRLRIAYVAGAA